jgi:hypothetical protein
MSPAHCIDNDLQKLFIHGGTGLNIGNENLSDLWQLDL